jgi:protein-S-isoprenylcysteine O-methyltransferase Ste14
VRNPMYVSAFLILMGLGVWTGAVSVFLYSLLLALSYHLFVRFYEEPHLQRVFGQSYAEYCAGVPRWWPRLTAWQRLSNLDTVSTGSGSDLVSDHHASFPNDS